MTQAPPGGADSRRRARPRAGGPYLLRRGATWYFRKRVSRPLAEKCSRAFLCLSLRTHVLRDAMIRAAGLLVAMCEAEEQVMRDLETTELSPTTIDAILAEALRRDLVRMIARQDTAQMRGDAEIDARISELEAEVTALRRAARRNDVAPVADWCREAADVLSVELPADIPASLGRKALNVKAEVASIEARVEDGGDTIHLAAPLVSTMFSAPIEVFLKPPVLLSQAFDKAIAVQTKKSMLPGMQAAKTLLLEFLGDIPLRMLTEDRQKAAFAEMARLPVDHGKHHGKNRYRATGKTMGKREEIERADARDELITEEVRAKDLSIAEKRHELAQRLTPRLTYRTLEKHRDVLNRVRKVAMKEFGVGGDIKIISYKDLEELLAQGQKDDPLYIRVTRPKDRAEWTEDRIGDLLTSPIYSGCTSAFWRWRPGDVIIRDATYWVPLIMLTMGTRLAEAVQLKRTSLVRHKGILCMYIGEGQDQRIKNDASRRNVPIPQILLDLGFVDWIRTRPDDHGVFLFPEALDRSSTGDPAGAFGSHLRNLFSRLDLADFNEDLYALRKTLATALGDKSVSDGIRQAILGHQQDKIVNKHYTAQKAQLLKESLDKADFGIAIEFSSGHGFPIIAACSLGHVEIYEADITLNDAGEPEVVTIIARGSSVPCFESRVHSSTKPAKPRTSSTKPGAFPALSEREVGQRVTQLVGQGQLRLPQAPQKLAALQYLLALA